MRAQTKPLEADPAASPATRDQEDSRALALAAVAAALEKKGLEPCVLDVQELASYTDYVVIISGRSDRQVLAISDAIVEKLKGAGHRPIGQEGQGGGQWTLLDYGDCIIHVFHHPVREFYRLESLWADAPRLPLDVPADARIGAEGY